MLVLRLDHTDPVPCERGLNAQKLIYKLKGFILLYQYQGWIFIFFLGGVEKF